MFSFAHSMGASNFGSSAFSGRGDGDVFVPWPQHLSPWSAFIPVARKEKKEKRGFTIADILSTDDKVENRKFIKTFFWGGGGGDLRLHHAQQRMKSLLFITDRRRYVWKD